jgi:hypothetical protein
VYFCIDSVLLYDMRAHAVTGINACARYIGTVWSFARMHGLSCVYFTAVYIMVFGMRAHALGVCAHARAFLYIFDCCIYYLLVDFFGVRAHALAWLHACARLFFVFV